MTGIGLYWRTVRHLTWQQLIYQLLHRLRGPARLILPGTTPEVHFLPVPEQTKAITWQKGTFTFLNQPVQFSAGIDWNYAQRGKLWTYNLNYFDFLNQPGMQAGDGLLLIHDFMRQTDSLRDGLESYPTSLRIINWVQFLSRHQIREEAIHRHLFAQVRLLHQRLEYHLSGNHLLENGFALLTGSLFFRHEQWFQTATRLIRRELTAQIGADGGHYERSPMYQQLLLDRLLDVLLILESETWNSQTGLHSFLTQKGLSMLGWLNAITFEIGTVPMVNDAAWGIAPSTSQLREKASGLLPKKACFSVTLIDSGYRMFREKRYELFTSVGSIGPAHQPGHAHADTFSFVLHVDNQPIIVDIGTSTYQSVPRRAWERSTKAHNTVTVQETDSSEVWAGFRVGRRARVTLLADTKTILTARHDGYRKLGIVHERTWVTGPGTVEITDRLLDSRTKNELVQEGIARFYFHSAVTVALLGDGVRANSIGIHFRSETKPQFLVKDCTLANGFNQVVSSYCLEVRFTARLHTTLTLLA